MICITDKTYQPNLAELSEYTSFPLFDQICKYLETQFSAKYEIMYSGDSVLLGWNIRFYKSGRTLCRLYPDHGHFQVLLVVGRREVERVLQQLPQMSRQMQEIYENTQEGMGQRWLLIPIEAENDLYRDLLELITIRRQS